MIVPKLLYDEFEVCEFVSGRVGEFKSLGSLASYPDPRLLINIRYDSLLSKKNIRFYHF